jgi:hypothetical protein
MARTKVTLFHPFIPLFSFKYHLLTLVFCSKLHASRLVGRHLVNNSPLKLPANLLPYVPTLQPSNTNTNAYATGLWWCQEAPSLSSWYRCAPRNSSIPKIDWIAYSQTSVLYPSPQLLQRVWLILILLDSNVSSEKLLKTLRPTWDSNLLPSVLCKRLLKLTSSPCSKVPSPPCHVALYESYTNVVFRHQLVRYPRQACHYSTQGYATCSSSPWRTLIDFPLLSPPFSRARKLWF